jgi:hypothetical protein
MKIKKFGLLFLCIAAFLSCDELDELTEFDITEDFTTTFNINIPEDSEGEPQSFSDSATIDITTNQEIQDNLDLIQDVDLNSLTFVIDNFVGADGTTVTSASVSAAGTTVSIADINLQQADANGTVYEVADSALLNDIANILENNSQITVTISGTINNTPATFDVIVTLDVTVTVDVI